MKLKWHYINICDKIDSFWVVRHGFWLIWLWSHLILIILIQVSFSSFVRLPKILSLNVVKKTLFHILVINLHKVAFVKLFSKQRDNGPK
jgi:hypothetical protein